VIELIKNHIKYVIRYILKFPSLFSDVNIEYFGVISLEYLVILTFF